jgi:WD40 repeat protein
MRKKRNIELTNLQANGRQNTHPLHFFGTIGNIHSFIEGVEMSYPFILRSRFGLLFRYSIILLMAFFALSACQVSNIDPVQGTETSTLVPTITPMIIPSETPTSAPTASPTATWIASPVSPGTATPTATPTETAIPTAIASPVLVGTATPDLPVGIGTAAPVSGEPITVDNADQLVELARYGTPVVWDIQITMDQSKLFVTTSAGVLILDTDTRDEIASFDIMGRRPYSSNIYPDQSGDYFLVITREDAQVWSLDGEILWQLGELPDGYTSAAISPEGELVVIGYEILRSGTSEMMDPFFDVYDTVTSEIVFSERGSSPIFSPDGRLLAVDFDRSVWVWDTDAWEKVTSLFLDETWNTKRIFSPDSQFIAIAHPDQVELWRLEDRKMVRVISGFENREYAPHVMYGLGGRMILIQDQYRQSENDILIITVWDTVTGELINTQPVNEEWGTLHWLDHDNQVITYTYQTALNEFQNVGDQPAMGFYPDNNLFVLNRSQNLEDHLCSISPVSGDLSCETAFEWHLISDLTRQQYTVLDVDDQHAALYAGDGETEDALIILQHDGLFIPELMLSRQGKFVYSTYAGPKIVDIQTGERIKQWDASSRRIIASHDERYLAFFMTDRGRRIFISSYRLIVYDLVNHVEAYRKNVTDADLSEAFTFLPDNRFVFVTEQHHKKTEMMDLQLNVVDLETRKSTELLSHQLQDEPYLSAISMEVSPDESMAVVGLTNGVLILFDFETGEEIADWQAHSDEIINLAFSSDGSMLASSGRDGFIRLWGIWP